MKFIKVATGETSSEIPTQLRQVRHSLRVTKLLDEGENATIPHFNLHLMTFHIYSTQVLIRHVPAVFANFASPTVLLQASEEKRAEGVYPSLDPSVREGFNQPVSTVGKIQLKSYCCFLEKQIGLAGRPGP